MTPHEHQLIAGLARDLAASARKRRAYAAALAAIDAEPARGGGAMPVALRRELVRSLAQTADEDEQQEALVRAVLAEARARTV